MNMEYGFVEFYDKNDQTISSFFREANNRDILGLRKMNIRISNVLFPFGNTLMPNLVYFYYLNAIYHAYIEVNDRVPVPRVIDAYEKLISQRICKDESLKKKGFFNDAKSRAYGKYRSSMERMKFFEYSWKAHEDMPQTALEGLKETQRYRYVKAVIEANKGKEKLEIPEELRTWPVKMKPNMLEDVERLDFIRRVVRPYKEEVPEYSVFTNIVMHYAGIKRLPNAGETIYKEDWLSKCKPKENSKLSRIETFTNWYECEGGEAHGFSLYFERISKKINRCEDYIIALVYSKLQWIAKLAYNTCLFENMESRRKEYYEKLKQEIQGILAFVNVKDTIYTEWNRLIKSKRVNIFTGIEPGAPEPDALLVEAFDFTNEILKSIRRTGTNIDECIADIIEMVKKREKESMGDSSILDSGIRADKPMMNYVDTFRWQYRPEEAYAETEENGQADTAEVDNALSTMSASYYIYELFFEPYE